MDDGTKSRILAVQKEVLAELRRLRAKVKELEDVKEELHGCKEVRRWLDVQNYLRKYREEIVNFERRLGWVVERLNEDET